MTAPSARERTLRGVHLFLDIALAGVFLVFALTALGVRIDLRLFGGHQRVTGAQRPFLALLALVLLRLLAEPGIVRRLLDRARGAAPPASAADGAAARRVRRLLAAGAFVVIASPLVEGPYARWDDGPSLRAGLLLLTVVTYAYARFASRRALPSWPRLAAADVFLLVAFPVYVAAISSGDSFSSGDNLATSRLGALVVRRGTLDLSSLPEYRRDPLPYDAVRIGGRVLPAFPLGTGLLSIPYSALALVASGGEITETLFFRWEKHLATLLVSGAAVLFFLAMRRRHGDAVALAATFVFAFATPAFSTASQGLWSTTGELFFLSLALFLLRDDAGAVRLAAAGAALGLAFLCRPTALLVGAVLVLLVVLARGRRAWPLAVALLLTTGVTVTAHEALYGHPLGGYGLMNAASGMWASSLRAGAAAAAANLVSPSRGLFVFFPYLVLAGLGASFLTLEERRRWLASLGIVGAFLLLTSSYSKWWGGFALGPRLMTEASPFFATALLPALASWKRIGRGRRFALAATVLFAAATQVLLVERPNAAEWCGRVDVDRYPTAVWSIRDSQIGAAWRP